MSLEHQRNGLSLAQGAGGTRLARSARQGGPAPEDRRERRRESCCRDGQADMPCQHAGVIGSNKAILEVI